MLKSIIKDILNFFFPPLCLICENLKEDKFFCKSCLELILRSKIHPPFCKKCGRSLKGHKCSIKLKYIDEVYAIFNYNDIIKELIESYKFRRYTKISEFFVPFVIERIEKVLPPFDVIIPVPLHPSKERERGFNQNVLILESVKKIFKINYRNDILIRLKPTRPQSRIKEFKKREENVWDAFKVIKSNEVKYKRILLFDDVLTSGKTLEECAKVLKLKGSEKVFALSIATGS